MCFAVKCNKCGKTTWKGCGMHVEQVMRDVPKSQQCECPREGAAPAAPASSSAESGSA
ncbi:MAG: hypothetical protein BYD32DRAFT_416027 [Podila humilis]|nr:MAG: hypothetical protein BYD32DRAFT_416027 [Podila humilis]